MKHLEDVPARSATYCLCTTTRQDEEVVRGMTKATLAVLASRVRVEEKQLMSSLRRRCIRYRQVDTRELSVPLDENPNVWRAVLNREISHTRASYAARSLEALGAVVVNSAAATEICGDKLRTSLALRRAGLPTPRTALAMTPTAALCALDDFGYPAVIKPLVGSWGRLVSLIPDRQTAVTVLEYLSAMPSPQTKLVYLQELVGKTGWDIRVIVVGGEVIGATCRRGADWRSNVARGAVSRPYEPAPTTAALAVAAAAAVGAEIAGVDLIEDHEGRPLVIEVNDRVEFAGFQAAHGDRIDVAERILDHVLTRCPA